MPRKAPEKFDPKEWSQEQDDKLWYYHEVLKMPFKEIAAAMGEGRTAGALRKRLHLIKDARDPQRKQKREQLKLQKQQQQQQRAVEPAQQQQLSPPQSPPPQQQPRLIAPAAQPQPQPITQGRLLQQQQMVGEQAAPLRVAQWLAQTLGQCDRNLDYVTNEIVAADVEDSERLAHLATLQDRLHAERDGLLWRLQGALPATRPWPTEGSGQSQPGYPSPIHLAQQQQQQVMVAGGSGAAAHPVDLDPRLVQQQQQQQQQQYQQGGNYAVASSGGMAVNPSNTMLQQQGAFNPIHTMSHPQQQQIVEDGAMDMADQSLDYWSPSQGFDNALDMVVPPVVAPAVWHQEFNAAHEPQGVAAEQPDLASLLFDNELINSEDLEDLFPGIFQDPASQQAMFDESNGVD